MTRFKHLMYCPNCGQFLCDDIGMLELENQEAAEKLWDYVHAVLRPRYSEVLERRFRFSQTYECIAEKFGLTRERIRIIQAQAIQKLREKHSMREINIILGRNPNYMIQETTEGTEVDMPE